MPSCRPAPAAAPAAIVHPVSSTLARVPEPDLRSIFAYYDRDGDGYLAREELLGALRAAGACPSAADVDEACRVWGAEVGPEAFAEAAKSLLAKRPLASDLVMQFRGMAPGGLVDAAALRHLTMRYGDCLEPAEADELLRLAGPDAEGNVDVRRLAEALLPPLRPA